MVWDNWNPIRDIKDAWIESKSVWGKISVVMFYIFFWMLIVLSVCEIILPFTMNADCSVQGSNASIKAWMALNGREWSYFELAWSLLML